MMTQTNAPRPIYVRAAKKPWSLLNRIIVWIASKFGSKAKEVERFLKFVFVGVIGTVVDFSTLLVLQATLLQPQEPNKDTKVIAAATIAFLAAIASNFVWNRFWTYPDSRSRSMRRQLVQFTLINSVGLAIRTLWVSRTYRAIGAALLPFFVAFATEVSPSYTPAPEAAAKIGTLASTVVAIAFVMIWNFFANRYWTYNDVE